MSIWIYARVSTFDQYVNGYSVDQQVRSCLEYVKQHNMMLGDTTNCDLPGVFIDGGKSAFKKKLIQRPGGCLLLQNAKPGDTIIALATHRLFRQFGDMVAVMDKWVTDGVNVRFVDYPTLNTDTANGKAMLYIMAVMAQLKSELISARVKESRGIAGAKQKPEPPTPKPTIVEKTTKDLGAVMQQMQIEREKSKFTFCGRVHAYVRVSTREQTVEHQIEMIKKLLPEDMKNAEIIWYSDEGASAFKTKFERRKAGSTLLQELKPGDMVVAWRPDRLFRSLIDASRVLEKIHATGASLTIVEGNIRTDQAQGRMLMQMMSMFAEMESQDISRMTKLGHFGSIGVNPAARAVRMPKLLRSMKKHHLQKYYQFEDVLTPEERFYMHVELSLTQHNYRDRRTACRVISNKYLAKKGLPPVTGEFGDLVTVYIKRLKNMQKEEFSTRRQRLIEKMKKQPAKAEIRYPLNVSTIAWIDKRQKEFLRVAKMFPGRLRDKQALTMLASSCASPEAAVVFVERVR